MRIRRAGDRALLLEVGGPLQAAAPDQVAALRAEVDALVAQGRLAAPVDLVPGARTLLLDGVDVETAVGLLAGWTPGRATPPPVPPDRPVEVPVVYDGPDLAGVAALWGVTEREVVARHTSTLFRVAFCGFAPGFPYLVGLDADVPRRSSPRPRVPAGAVGLAGRYCGIYPTASPGGWQLLGTTSAALFAVDRDPPALLPPGTLVRFRATAPAAAPVPPARARPGPAPAGGRVLTVVRAGALSTVQDAGRPGLAHLGVPRAGPLDRPAARLANRLVGNHEDAALLETTIDGCALMAGTAMTLAVTGAVAAVTAGGRAKAWGVAVGVAAGEVLDVGTATRGVRCYLAVAGGLAVPEVLGSRSTDTLSGLGPGRLVPGDRLPVGRPVSPTPAVEFTVPGITPGPLRLRLRLGPRADWFGPESYRALRDGPWTLSPVGDRVGVRLSGPPVPRRRSGELESEGMVLGAVQVPPNGGPVVLLADHPTTGGYPVVGVVDPRDLGPLAQLRPGAAVRFTADLASAAEWPT